MYRVALILAILAAIGSLALSFTVTKPKIEGLTQANETLTSERDTANAAKDEAIKTAKAATATAEKKTAELAVAQKDLEAKTAEATTQTERANKYFADYNKTLAERNSAQEQLAQWTALNIPPTQIIALQKELKDSKADKVALLDQEKILNRNIVSLKNKLSKYEDEQQVIAMPGLKGNVVAVDNKWDFVILDVGANQGALEGGQLMVRRGDKLVGKVKLVTVEPNRSVANVMSDWKQGDVAVAAGDVVLY